MSSPSAPAGGARGMVDLLHRALRAAVCILEIIAGVNAIDLIGIGRHGHGEVQAALLGKVAEETVRKPDCAVPVVPLSFAAKGKTG